MLPINIPLASKQTVRALDGKSTYLLEARTSLLPSQATAKIRGARPATHGFDNLILSATRGQKATHQKVNKKI